MPPVRSVVQTLGAPDEAIDPRVDLVELRLDLYPALDVPRFIATSAKPVVVSVRRASDGGQWRGDEEARALLLGHAQGAAWVDVEVDAQGIATPPGTRRIVSFHDVRGVPPDLGAVYTRCVAAGGDRVKLAVTPDSCVEGLRLLDLPEPAIGLGEYGTITRVLAHWTWCALEPVAPGMPRPEDLFDLYDIRRLSARPALFGVAGDPVEHSRSPHLHNPRFAAEGLDAVYLRFRVADLPAFWPEFVARGGVGLSITSPLKVAAAALATRPSPEVRSCGAANTLLSDGRAFNTDYRAFLELAGLLPGRDGAGGEARWDELLAVEAELIAGLPAEPTMHSGMGA